MKGKKKVPEGPVAFIKSDKSRIIEVSEGKDGKFELVGTYMRIELANIPLAKFAPKHSAAYMAKKNLEANSQEEDQDPLTKGFRIPKEDVEQIAILIEGGATRPIDICKEVGVSMPTFMAVFKRLKELGKIAADATPRRLGKSEEGEE